MINPKENFNRGKVGGESLFAICAGQMAGPLIITERDIPPPLGREETATLKSRGDCLQS